MLGPPKKVEFGAPLKRQETDKPRGFAGSGESPIVSGRDFGAGDRLGPAKRRERRSPSADDGGQDEAANPRAAACDLRGGEDMAWIAISDLPPKSNWSPAPGAGFPRWPCPKSRRWGPARLRTALSRAASRLRPRAAMAPGAEVLLPVAWRIGSSPPRWRVGGHVCHDCISSMKTNSALFWGDENWCFFGGCA